MNSFNNIDDYKKQFELAEDYRNSTDKDRWSKFYSLGYKFVDWKWSEWDDLLVERIEKIQKYFKLVQFWRKQKIVFTAKNKNKLEIFQILYELFDETIYQVTFTKNKRVQIVFDPDGVSYKSSTKYLRG